jgi:hypothetical protein
MMTSRPTIVFRCAALAVAALAGIACRESRIPSLAAQQRAEPRESQPSAARTFTLEFDVSDDILQRRADGAFVVTAFQVGFFDGSTLVRALEIPRSAAQFVGKRVRLEVPLVTLSSRSSSSVEVRVRGLSSGPLGPWSASAGSLTLPIEERPQRSRRARSGTNAERQPQPGGRRVTVQQLSQFPSLKTALAPVLRGASEEEAAGACQTIQDLATAVVLSRRHALTITRLCGALRGRADGALEELLGTVRPPVDVAREIRAARTEARGLVRNRP